MGGNVGVSSGNGHFFAEGRVHCHLVLTGRTTQLSAATTAIRKREWCKRRKLKLAHDVLLKPGAPRGTPGGD
jgi:hypothetical protein